MVQGRIGHFQPTGKFSWGPHAPPDDVSIEEAETSAKGTNYKYFTRLPLFFSTKSIIFERRTASCLRDSQKRSFERLKKLKKVFQKTHHLIIICGKMISNFCLFISLLPLNLIIFFHY